MVRCCLSEFAASDGEYNFGEMSCEHIAEHIVSHLGIHSCEVMEDGIRGATVTRSL